jgi:hypothetical protein
MEAAAILSPSQAFSSVLSIPQDISPCSLSFFINHQTIVDR